MYDLEPLLIFSIIHHVIVYANMFLLIKVLAINTYQSLTTALIGMVANCTFLVILVYVVIKGFTYHIYSA
jgi:hypothetical protein